jgi:hypothetical protein
MVFSVIELNPNFLSRMLVRNFNSKSRLKIGSSKGNNNGTSDFQSVNNCSDEMRLQYKLLRKEKDLYKSATPNSKLKNSEFSKKLSLPQIDKHRLGALKIIGALTFKH